MRGQERRREVPGREETSTALGEELDRETYYGLVKEFFLDISGPVLDRDGEIYEYVGDEVVIT